MSDPSPWATFRAALLAAVIAVQLLFAAPVPHVVTARDLRRPVSRDEVAAWAERLDALGYPIRPEELGDRIRRVTGALGGAHRSLKAPFRPWMRFTGTGQGWALFANPDTHPGRLEIRVRREGQRGSEVLYRQADAEARWGRRWLAYRRLRGLWDADGQGQRPSGSYRRFARWVADRMFAAEPDVEWVSVRMVFTHTTLPGAPPDRAEDAMYELARARPGQP